MELDLELELELANHKSESLEEEPSPEKKAQNGDTMQEEKTMSETARLFSEALAESKLSPKQTEAQASDTEPKKVTLKDSEPARSPILEPVQFQPVYRRTSTIKEREKSPESELEEISSKDFKKKSPDKKLDQSLDTRPIFFDSKGVPHTKKIEDSESPNDHFVYSSQFNKDERRESPEPWRGGKTYSSWKETDEEIRVNCVMVYNLEPRVDEEIIFELFSKVGKIKRMKLFRITKKEIDSSYYLRTLGLSATSANPHKKKALLEYLSPTYVDNAIEVFNNLKLYGRKIFVTKFREEQKFHIIIKRPGDQCGWLDEFFCLDYFSKETNLVRVYTKKEQDNRMKFVMFFACQADWQEAKELVNRDLKKYITNKVEISYNPAASIYSRDKTREIQTKTQERLPLIDFSSLVMKDNGVTTLSENESGEEKGMEVL